SWKERRPRRASQREEQGRKEQPYKPTFEHDACRWLRSEPESEIRADHVVIALPLFSRGSRLKDSSGYMSQVVDGCYPLIGLIWNPLWDAEKASKVRSDLNLSRGRARLKRHSGSERADEFNWLDSVSAKRDRQMAAVQLKMARAAGIRRQ